MTDFAKLCRDQCKDGRCMSGDTCVQVMHGEPCYTAIADEIDRLNANLDRRTGTPADHRYWEGRYRDEAAANERLTIALDPRRWTQEHIAAWHRNIPDTFAAFEALRAVGSENCHPDNGKE